MELKEDVDDVQKVVDDVKTLVDTIDTFPEDAETPLIQEITIKDEAINIAVYGDVSERNLRRTAEKVREDLLALKEISQVNRRVNPSISFGDISLGLHVTPPLAPPKGIFTTAAFQVIHMARARTSSRFTSGW